MTLHDIAASLPNAAGAIALVSSEQCAETSAPKAAGIHGRVLLVDDEPVTRQIISRRLHDDRFDVVTAENGRQALSALSEYDIDLVLMDISMPVMDGFTTLRLMRQMYDRSVLPIIMMTSAKGNEQVLRCFDNGANDYISKPVDFSVMKARIESQFVLRDTQFALRESEQRYALASQGTRDGIWDWNIVTGATYLSPRWLEMVGASETHALGTGLSWLDLVFHEDRARVKSDLESHLCGESEHFETELRMPNQDGGFRWMLCRGLAIRDEDGIATRIAGSLTDITEGKVADALTRLPNRTLFHDRVARCVELYKRNSARKFAVLYMDVDDFKLINDSLGHGVGDQFLIKFSERLESSLRQCDAVIARLGGDEFGVLLENVRNVDEALTVAHRLQEKIRIPFMVADRELLSRASIGVVAVSPECSSVDEIIRRADTAMYNAKKFSESHISVFDNRMLAESSTRFELNAEMKQAIRRDELSLNYQPIIDATSMKTAGFEALVRWHHPIHGNVPPAQFIPIAESNGLIVEIGDWVLCQACQQAARWNAMSDSEMMISVNVSVRQLNVPGFADRVAEVVAQTGIKPRQLKLEVTESMLMQKPDEMIGLLSQLQEMGVTTSIDDFGTGYSSLAYLHQMPLNVLKIDRSFIVDLAESRKHQAIVRSIIALARSLELEVIAEGIETQSQAAYLQGLQCDYFQGFRFSRPVTPNQASMLVDKQWPGS